jgi:hypothetical protein
MMHSIYANHHSNDNLCVSFIPSEIEVLHLLSAPTYLLIFGVKSLESNGACLTIQYDSGVIVLQYNK